ncbi:Mitochondrial zinc maintenance protein 1, mitochondrial [Coelomomyces lativittatus]|nr:Mitochondrial zinc maintenance protein 1, mitochondrial [Coelomomyces lativittatus]KAJ1507816.1 Mitochondrial zinc maintenance protein 1, mitochondrial [Coelomomyces lativittatus]KAJ1508040.1 Mitochondrial zinc maintenance protein 1, mitochondrial [Coelomomyces lativittatus]
MNSRLPLLSSSLPLTPFKSKAKSMYRELLKSQKIAFQDDVLTQQQARQLIRKKFNETQQITNLEDLEKLLQHAKDVALILRQNVVQGKRKKNEKHVYEIKLDPTRHEINHNHELKKKKELHRDSTSRKGLGVEGRLST